MRLADQICFKKNGKTVPTFLKKTYEILEDQQNYKAIKWASNGIGFIVIDQEEFSKIVLPKYFKHSNYSSFVRQLNMYNFHKIREDRFQSYFHHQFFDINNKSLLSQIKRKPQKKRRKIQDSQDQLKQNQFESNKRIDKGSRCVRKQSNRSIQQKKKVCQNTRQVFNSQNDNQQLELHVPVSQNILSIDAEDDRMSINEGIGGICPQIDLRELINPSNNNLILLNYSRPLSNGSLIL